MDAGNPLPRLLRVPFRSAGLKLLKKMTPLKVNLSPRNRNPAGGRRLGDPRGVEPVSPSDRFRVHGPQVLGNVRDRLGLFAKPQQLRMMPIAPGFTLQHRLGEQSFPPQRNQPFGI